MPTAIQTTKIVKALLDGCKLKHFNSSEIFDMNGGHITIYGRVGELTYRYLLYYRDGELYWGIKHKYVWIDDKFIKLNENLYKRMWFKWQDKIVLMVWA